MADFSDAELMAFIDEALPAVRSSELETSLRTDDGLRQRLAEVTGREIAGLHTLSAIWRRGRLSCATREDLGLHLLGALDPEHSAYIDFHIDQIGCRYCAANRDDLKSSTKVEDPSPRRKRYFQTSAGHLRGKSQADDGPTSR